MEWSALLVWVLLVVGFLVFGALLMYRRNGATHVRIGWWFYLGLALVAAGIALGATVGMVGAALILAGGVLMFTCATRSHRSVER